MIKRLLLVTVLLMAVKANATDRSPMQPSPPIINAPIGVGVGFGGLGGNGGSINAPAPDYSDLRIVPPAIAPSTSTNVICPIVQQGSKAGSVFFFSGSGTTSPEINAICLAWHGGDKELIHAIACADSSSYRKASEKLGRSCK